jgi:hypothetical protein
MAYTAKYLTESPFLSDDKVAVMRKETADFQKCVLGNFARLVSLCDIGAVCGSDLDPESCVPIEATVLRRIVQDFAKEVLAGMPSRDKKDTPYLSWNTGGLGSRWVDMDASKYGIDYIRAAFYSKKHMEGDWPWDTPYMIRITCEKAKKD